MATAAPPTDADIEELAQRVTIHSLLRFNLIFFCFQ